MFELALLYTMFEYKLTPQQEASFKPNDGVPLTLLPGTILYRFCKNTDNKLGAYWFDKETMKKVFRKFKELNDRSAFRNIPISRFATLDLSSRKTLALSVEWNNLSYLHTVEVKKPITAYRGGIKEQPYSQKGGISAIKLEGSGIQYVIPLVAAMLEDKKGRDIFHFLHTVEFRAFADTSWYKRLVINEYNLPEV